MSLKNRLPEVVRIKRKRTEDPLQALIFENTRLLKKSKSSTFLFKLARTDNENDGLQTRGSSLLQPNIQDSSSSTAKERKTFLLPSGKKGSEKESIIADEVDEEDQVPQELADMVKEYLQLESRERAGSQPASSRHTNTKPSPLKNEVTIAEQDLADRDYVYDVYHRDKAIYDENEKLGLNIGIIKFADEDLDLLNEEEGNDSDAVQLSDDEDSNAEDFYRNDYPENEDDDKGIVIGNEDEWYSEEDAYRSEDDEYSSPGRRFVRDFEDETVLEKLKKENKAFGSLSMEEVDYLYHEFYDDKSKKSMIDEDY